MEKNQDSRFYYNKPLSGKKASDAYANDLDQHPERARSSYSGLGPKNWKRSDERIREEACERLLQSPLVDATHIEVEVKDGHINLRGTVDDRFTKRAAESCLEDLPGVQDVRNELRIAPPANL